MSRQRDHRHRVLGLWATGATTQTISECTGATMNAVGLTLRRNRQTTMALMDRLDDYAVLMHLGDLGFGLMGRPRYGSRHWGCKHDAFRKHNGRHRAIARARFHGASVAAIAERFGMLPTSVRRILNSPSCGEHIRAMHDKATRQLPVALVLRQMPACLAPSRPEGPEAESVTVRPAHAGQQVSS